MEEMHSIGNKTFGAHFKLFSISHPDYETSLGSTDKHD